MQRYLSYLLVALLVLPLPARASDVIDAARDASGMLEAAHETLKEARNSSNRILAMTKAIRAYDVALLAMRSGLRDLRAAADTARAAYEEKRGNVEELLSGMLAVSQAPRPLTFVHPGGAVGAARAGMTMKDLLPAMSEEADELRRKVEKLATIAALQEVAEQDLRVALDELREARVSLKTAVFEDRRVRGILRDDTLRLARLAKNARDLRGLVEGLQLLPTPPEPADAPEMRLIKGAIPLPVAGKVIRNFRERDAAGIPRAGIIIGTRTSAIVTAPLTSRVRYTGRFLDHGLVVILEPEPGYMMIFAGLGEISVVPGQAVNAGRPIGLMPGRIDANEEFLIESGEASGDSRAETLYIELRRNGIAENPAPWFRRDEVVTAGQ